MKRSIAILLACILLATLLFVIGCDEKSPDTGDDVGNNDNNGDNNNDSNGDNTSGDAGNNGDSGDSDDIESPVSDFLFELNDDGSTYTVIK